MKKLQRPGLKKPLQARLDVLSSRFESVTPRRDRVSLSNRLWKREGRATGVTRKIRLVLEKMAPYPGLCVYCTRGEGTDIDHFRPRSLNPKLTFQWKNLLLACSGCNSNHKRDQFPRDQHSGERLLLDPTRDDPALHLRFIPRTGRFRPKTPKGEASIKVFGLNRKGLPKLRALAWFEAQGYVQNYATAKTKADSRSANICLRLLSAFPYSLILATMLRYARLSAPSTLLLPDVALAVRTYPELSALC